MVRVRVDEHIKTQATETFAAIGLTVPDAIRVFLTRVVADQQLPLALKAPNTCTRAAMKEPRAMSKARFASVSELIHDVKEAAKLFRRRLREQASRCPGSGGYRGRVAFPRFSGHIN